MTNKTYYEQLTAKEKALFNKIDAELYLNKVSNSMVLLALLQKQKAPDYARAYNILMDYFDSIPEEDKQQVDKDLKECGL